MRSTWTLPLVLSLLLVADRILGAEISCPTTTTSRGLTAKTILSSVNDEGNGGEGKEDGSSSTGEDDKTTTTTTTTTTATTSITRTVTSPSTTTTTAFRTSTTTTTSTFTTTESVSISCTAPRTTSTTTTTRTTTSTILTTTTATITKSTGTHCCRTQHKQTSTITCHRPRCRHRAQEEYDPASWTDTISSKFNGNFASYEQSNSATIKQNKQLQRLIREQTEILNGIASSMRSMSNSRDTRRSRRQHYDQAGAHTPIMPYMLWYNDNQEPAYIHHPNIISSSTSSSSSSSSSDHDIRRRRRNYKGKH